jgi:chitin synthase
MNNPSDLYWQYTTRAEVLVREKQAIVEVSPGAPNAVPCQMILCLKEKSQKKINSHRWVFSALCKELSPVVCVLLPAGAMLSSSAIYELWKNVVFDDRVGCAISHSKVFTGSISQGLSNTLIGFQKFENQLENMLQQPFDTLTQLRSGVVRGGLFAYRLVALSDKDGETPLSEYYGIEKSLGKETSLFWATRFFVEEKILSWALLTSRFAWKTILVNTATVSNDVPEDIVDLVLQRRRWINGSFWGSFQELFSLTQIQWGKKNAVDWTRLIFAFTYQALDLLTKWFAIVRNL